MVAEPERDSIATENSQVDACRSPKWQFHRSRIEISHVIIAIVLFLNVFSVSAAQSATSPASAPAFTFNMSKLQLAGVPLVQVVSRGYHGFPQKQLITALTPKLGKPHVFASHICSGRMPVSVAAWQDLSLVFVHGVFGILYYNFRGWPAAQQIYPAPPPLGVALVPFIKTEFGATVGDSAAKVTHLDPHLNFRLKNRFIGVTPISSFILSTRTGVIGQSESDYVVSQIQTTTGNC